MDKKRKFKDTKKSLYPTFNSNKNNLYKSWLFSCGFLNSWIFSPSVSESFTPLEGNQIGFLPLEWCQLRALCSFYNEGGEEGVSGGLNNNSSEGFWSLYCEFASLVSSPLVAFPSLKLPSIYSLVMHWMQTFIRYPHGYESLQ
jgi:hypothetical protein